MSIRKVQVCVIFGESSSQLPPDFAEAAGVMGTHDEVTLRGLRFARRDGALLWCTDRLDVPLPSLFDSELPIDWIEVKIELDDDGRITPGRYATRSRRIGAAYADISGPVEVGVVGNDYASTIALAEAIIAGDVTPDCALRVAEPIEVRADVVTYSNTLTPEQEGLPVAASRHGSYLYRGTPLTNRSGGLCWRTDDLNAELPEVYRDGYLSVDAVEVTVLLPRARELKIGGYRHWMFPGCIADIEVVRGKRFKRLTVKGRDLSMTLAFTRQILGGKHAPTFTGPDFFALLKM